MIILTNVLVTNEVILFKDNSVGSEPDTDLLEQWGKFVPEIKTVSDSLIEPDSAVEALIFLNNNIFNCLGACRCVRHGRGSSGAVGAGWASHFF